MYSVVAWLFEITPWWLAALLVLGLHAYARRYSREQGRHLIYGTGDVVLLAACSFFLVVMLFAIASDPFIEETTSLDFWSLGFAISLIGTVTMSARAAGDDRSRLGASLAAKAAILLLLPLTILPILLAIFGTKRDRRFRDGTKGNAQTELIGLAAATMTWLVGSLHGPVLVAEKSRVIDRLGGNADDAPLPMHTGAANAANLDVHGADEDMWSEEAADTDDLRIYIARDGVMIGDFERWEIQQGLATGRFHPSDDAWVEYSPSWVKIADLPPP
jgi:hypothetical protein